MDMSDMGALMVFREKYQVCLTLLLWDCLLVVTNVYLMLFRTVSHIIIVLRVLRVLPRRVACACYLWTTACALTSFTAACSSHF